MFNRDVDDHVANNFSVLRSKIRRLPPIHQATLRALVEHLARIASHSDKNKMDPKNLAIVFGSVIFGEDEMPKGADLLGMQSWKVSSRHRCYFHLLTAALGHLDGGPHHECTHPVPTERQ